MPRSQLLVFIGIGVFVLIIVLVVGGFIFGRKSFEPKEATLEFWGLEDEEAWRDIISKFQEKNNRLTIRYTKMSEETYEETLVNRLAEDSGPDVFLLKNSWIAKHRDKILPLPKDAFNVTANDVKTVFVDTVADELLLEGDTLIGLPVFINTPALFYNKDIFNAAGIATAPQTWEEVVQISNRLKKITPADDIARSGIALGDAKNVEHAFEIIQSLLLQNGERIIDRGTRTVELGNGAVKAFGFYASFSDKKSPSFSWTGRMKNSLDAFAEGETAMVIGFPEDIERLRAKNPHLNFDVKLFPLLKDARRQAVHARYFFPVVSKRSPNTVAGWQFILYLSSDEASKIYLEKTGKAPARRDLIAKGIAGELDIFYKQSLIARGWPIPDEQKTRRIFEEAITSLVSKQVSIDEAIARLREQLQLLIP